MLSPSELFVRKIERWFCAMIYSSEEIRTAVLAVGKFGVVRDRVQTRARVLGMVGPGTEGCQLGDGMEL